MPVAATRRGALALQVLLARPRAVRAAALAELLGMTRAPCRAAWRTHPGWPRERLAPEPSAVVRAVTDGLGAEVRRVAADVLAERGETAGPASGWPAAAVTLLRRAVFGGLVPLAGPGTPAGPEARALLDLSFAAVEEAVELRGAATLGVSVRGAPAAVVAQAAAGLGATGARAAGGGRSGRRPRGAQRGPPAGLGRRR